MKRKFTEKQKQERKSKIKAVIFKILRIFSYICAGLFWLLIIIGIASGSCSPKAKTKTVIAHASTDVVEQGPIFYPTDFVGGDIHYYFHLNYRNYNQISQFFPSVVDYRYFDSAIYNQNTGVYNIPIYGNGVNNSVILNTYNKININDVYPFVFTDVRFTYSGLQHHTLNMYFKYGSNSLLPIYTSTDSNDVVMAYDVTDWVSFYQDDVNNYGCYFYEILDFFFKGDVYFKEYKSDANSYYLINRFIAYYMSNYSFDFNGYQFGGLSKYLSTSYLFNRVYNGCFIYFPNQTDPEITVNLFKGLWEYHNTLYDRIDVVLVRAWNGTAIEDGESLDVRVNYSIGGESTSAIFNDIYNGENQFLTNYYIIKEMVMYNSVTDSPRVTLAYNRISYVYVYSVNVYYKQYSVSLNENPMLYQTDSFINNNSILFYVFKINYDYRLLTSGYNPVITYTYYSDFFFSTFNYTGLYGTKPPVNGNSTTSLNVFNPIFTIFSNGLTGLMSMFNAELLPGVTIGVIVLVPFTVTIILATVKLFKR